MLCYVLKERIFSRDHESLNVAIHCLLLLAAGTGTFKKVNLLSTLAIATS